MDYGTVFLYCLYACIQMYILMATGVFAFKRHFFSSKSVAMVSEMLFVYLIPLYGVVEISRIGTMDILKLFWILIVNFVIALAISYLLAVLCHYIFKLDERIRESFNLVCTIPAMGALPLVIGKAFCFPGGPIEGDAYCDSMIGLMMLCYFVVCIAVFLIGFLFIFSDKVRNNSLQEKMIYLWHDLIDQLFKKDYTILYLFKKYIKDEKKALEMFEQFEKEHREDMKGIVYEPQESHHHHHHHHHKHPYAFNKDGQIAEGDVVIEDVKGFEDDDNEHNQHQHQHERMHSHHSKHDHDGIPTHPRGVVVNHNDSYFDNQSSCSSSDSSQRNEDIVSHHNDNAQKMNSFKHKNKLMYDQFVILFERKESFYPGHDIKTKFDMETKKEKRDIYFNKSGKHFKVDIDFEVPIDHTHGSKQRANTFAIRKKNFQLQTSEKFQKEKLDSLLQKQSQHPSEHDVNIKSSDALKDINNIDNDDKKDIIIVPEPEEHNNQNESHNNSNKELNIKLTEIHNQLSESMKKKSNYDIIKNYYQSAFDMIEADPNLFKLELVNEYTEVKNEILHKVSHNPPKYPIVRYVKIDRNAVKVINSEWEKFEPKLKIMSSSFKGIPNKGIDIYLFLTKVVSPPTMSVLVGLIICMSGVRDFVFDATNHYWSNFVDGISTLERVMVPFLFLLIGLSAASTNGLSMNVPLKINHIIIVFVLRFVIVPALGILAIYVWKECYGGIVKESFAFRIIMFFPWCLPSAPNMAVIVNLTQYFFEEYGYLILLQNVSSVVFLTILYLIYFVSVGL